MRGSELFEPLTLGCLVLKNRLVRSATYEGRCDQEGFPTEEYGRYYRELAKYDLGAIITGFAFISKDGRAMQPGQAGIDSEAKIPFYRQVTEQVHGYGSKIFMQIAHTGRQTVKAATGSQVYGVSGKKSAYFGEVPKVLTTAQIEGLIEAFAKSALRVKQSGFDGLQLHAAHGYLIHQFILPSINNRKDSFGVDRKTGLGTKFLDSVIDRVREQCGEDFPILVKISGGDDYRSFFTSRQLVNLIGFLDRHRVSGIEISYGTMDYALNIFRGKSIPWETIWRYNSRYKQEHRFWQIVFKKLLAPVILRKIKPFTPLYNLAYAKLAKEHTDIPIISVGGFRKGEEIFSTIRQGLVDLVGLCRPFLCEPDLARKLKADEHYISKCLSCNVCAIRCDSSCKTICYAYKNKALKF